MSGNKFLIFLFFGFDCCLFTLFFISRSIEQFYKQFVVHFQAHRNLPTFRTDSKVLAAGDCVPPQRGSPLTRSSPALPGQQISVQDEEMDAYLVTEMRFKQAEREKRKLLRRGTESEIQSPRPSRKTSSLQQLPRLSRSDSILQQ